MDLFTLMMERTNPLLNDNRAMGNGFDGFQIYDDAQKPVVEMMRKLSGRVVDLADRLLADEPVFEEGKILSIYSRPGRGKTHLLQAFLNSIKEADPRVFHKMDASFGNFSDDFMHAHFHGKSDPYDDARIVIVDDLFRQYPSVLGVNQLPPHEVQYFMEFATSIWEKKRIAIITANYPLLSGMFERIRMSDHVGRNTSRLEGVRAASKELPLPGKDYRKHRADERKAEGGDEGFTI